MQPAICAEVPNWRLVDDMSPGALSIPQCARQEYIRFIVAGQKLRWLAFGRYCGLQTEDRRTVRRRNSSMLERSVCLLQCGGVNGWWSRNVAVYNVQVGIVWSITSPQSWHYDIMTLLRPDAIVEWTNTYSTEWEVIRRVLSTLCLIDREFVKLAS